MPRYKVPAILLIDAANTDEAIGKGNELIKAIPSTGTTGSDLLGLTIDTVNVDQAADEDHPYDWSERIEQAVKDADEKGAKVPLSARIPSVLLPALIGAAFAMVLGIEPRKADIDMLTRFLNPEGKDLTIGGFAENVATYIWDHMLGEPAHIPVAGMVDYLAWVFRSYVGNQD